MDQIPGPITTSLCGNNRSISNSSQFDNRPYSQAQSSYSYPHTSLRPFSVATSVLPTDGLIRTGPSALSNKYRRAEGINDNNIDLEANTQASGVGPSRNSTIGQQMAELGHSCFCPNVLQTFTTTTNPIFGFGRSVGGDTLPSYHLGASELLSPHPSFQPHADQGLNHEAREAQTDDEASQHVSQTRHVRTVTPSNSSDRSASSTISSLTIQAPLSVEDRRYSLFVALYRICLDASATYAHAVRRPAGRSHIPGHNMRGARGGHYHPYNQIPAVHPQWRSRYIHGGGERTLMDYISAICTSLWRRARADLMAPHRAELTAVRDMRNLYVWSECLVQHIESQGPGHDGEENETDMDSLDDGITDLTVASRATSLCRYFRDREARSACERVCLELRGLTRGP
jgi:hypothetical protein